MTSEFREGSIIRGLVYRRAKQKYLAFTKEDNFKVRKLKLKDLIPTGESESADSRSDYTIAYSKSNEYDCKAMTISVENPVRLSHICTGRILSDILNEATCIWYT